MQFSPMFVCLLTLSSAPLLQAADPALVEEIIAKVNGDIITKSELERDRRTLEAELRARGVTGPQLGEQVEERSKDILRERIDGMLLVQKGKELGISVESEVSKQLAELQVQSKITDPEKFQSFIREQTGMPYEDYKSEMRNYFLRQRVLRELVGRDITIPRAELMKHYEANKPSFVREEQIFLREIFLSTEGKTPAEVAAIEKKAKDLAARSRKGERFTDLAKANSESVTKDEFGALPPFKRGEMNKELESVVWDKERGFVTDPIKLPNGYIILRVEEHHKAGQASFEDVENEIMEKLYMKEFQPGVRRMLTNLRTDAFLEIKPGYTDTGAAPGKNTAWTDPAQLKPETVTKEEVAGRVRRRRLFWMLPIPGTSTTVKVKPGTSASK
jgi:peptidyl-prolyl cis-trans isomerase SurA